MAGVAEKTNCECCINYVYNDGLGYYECLMDLDEDEMNRFLNYSFDNCPYFRFGDDYMIVRKQN